jgi:hypothetical protein
MNAKRKKDVNEKKIKQLALAERAKHCEGCPARIEVNATIPEHGLLYVTTSNVKIDVVCKASTGGGTTKPCTSLEKRQKRLFHAHIGKIR